MTPAIVVSSPISLHITSKIFSARISPILFSELPLLQLIIVYNNAYSKCKGDFLKSKQPSEQQKIKHGEVTSYKA